MIFGECAGCDWRNPKRSQRERSLTSALSTIIWRAGDGNTGAFCLSIRGFRLIGAEGSSQMENQSGETETSHCENGVRSNTLTTMQARSVHVKMSGSFCVRANNPDVERFDVIWLGLGF